METLKTIGLLGLLVGIILICYFVGMMVLVAVFGFIVCIVIITIVNKNLEKLRKKFKSVT